MKFDMDSIRKDFPALESGDVFFDGPGGTQVPKQTLDAMVHYLETSNANSHAAFITSRRTDETTAEARRAMADFLNAPDDKEIVFGPNMTTLTFNLSRAIGRILSEGDEIIVTRLDHDANIAPWLALEEQGAFIKWIDFDPKDCTLNMSEIELSITNRTKIVAVGYSSNLVGTINDVKRIIELGHEKGAWVFIDAVNAAPHIPIDVQELDCDFLVCSPYKFFGPHLGVLYGKYEILDQLPAYKVRPSGDLPPDKWETGTQIFEGQAGLTATINYLASIGEKYDPDHAQSHDSLQGRRLLLKKAFSAFEDHESSLFLYLLHNIKEMPGITLYGITDPKRIKQRVPTLAFRIEGISPKKTAHALAKKNIYAWDGDCYAFEPVRRLGLDRSGGVVRIGLSIYNTKEEVTRFLSALKELKYS